MCQNGENDRRNVLDNGGYPLQPIMHLPALNTSLDTPISKGFYRTKDAARIARIPETTFRSWREKGVIVPSLELTDGDGKIEIGYDYEAILLARLLRILRQNGESMRRSVATLRHCMARFGTPGPAWAEVKVFVFEGTEVFTYSEKDEWDSTVPSKEGQKALEELFGDAFAEVKEDADALLIPKEFLHCVQIDPSIRDGLPVVRETRVKTQTLRDMVEANWTPRLIVDLAYPNLTENKVRCAIGYEKFLDAQV